MSNIFSISESDVIGDRMSQTDFDALTGSGLEATFAEVVTQADNRATASMGGTPTTASVLALCKSAVIDIVLYYLHTRRANDETYKIPDHIVREYKMAVAWLSSKGTQLLASEGSVTPVDSPGISVSYPTNQWQRSQGDYL